MSLSKTIVTILTSANTILDLRLVCGQILAVLSSVVIAHGAVALAEQLNSTASDYGDGDSDLLLVTAELPPLARVAIFHGILCTVPVSQLFLTRVIVCKEENTSQVLGLIILKEALKLGNSADDGELVLSCARLLNHWMLRVLSFKDTDGLVTLNVPLNGTLEKEVLDHIWFTWEHYLDRVKHVTFETFMKFLEIRKKSLGDECNSYFRELLDNQIPLILHKKSAINATRCLVKYVSVKSVLEAYPDLPLLMVKSMCDFSKAGNCSEVLKALLSKHFTEIQPHEWQQYWIPTLFDEFVCEMMTFGFGLLINHLVITNPSSMSFAIRYILDNSKELSYNRCIILMCCVKSSRNAKVAEIKSQSKCDLPCYSVPLWKNVLPYYIIQSCIVHTDYRVQFSALRLLCTSRRTTELLEPQELKLIIDFFNNGLSIDSPSQRQELISVSKRLFLRIKDCSNFLKRKLCGEKRREDMGVLEPENSVNSKDLIKIYSQFCRELFDILQENLDTSSSFPRRASSLSLMKHFQGTLLNDFQLVKFLNLSDLISNEVTVYTLINSLNDDYEANKVVALSMLHSIPDVHQFISDRDVEQIFSCTFNMASSCKPPETLTASYLLKLIQSHPAIEKICEESSQYPTPSLQLCSYIHSKLRAEVMIASEDLTMAACTSPMYGTIACLRAVIKDIRRYEFVVRHLEWSEFVSDIAATLFSVSDITRPIVENDSPEGNIPMDLELLQTVVQNSIGNQNIDATDPLLPTDSSDDMIKKAKSVSAQMLLICAWRSIKEVSLLLGYFVQVLPLPPLTEAVINSNVIENIGEYFVSVLGETKHRGAFEQTYVGFLKVCETLWLCKDVHLNCLPRTWVQNILRDIESEEDRFCATRRSAGIPFIIQAVLSKEPDTRGNTCLKETVSRLLEYAQHQRHGVSTRLHSFNILRAVYRDAKLGDVVIPYVSAGVMAAIDGFNSTHWSIRNAATLLFSVLITRMVGVKRNKDDLHVNNTMSGLVFFKRFPDLYTFLLTKLECGVSEIDRGMIAASIYPVLLLLARLSPAPLEGITSSLCLARFVPYVISCTTSQIYQLRDLASRALGPLVSKNNFQATLALLFEQARSCQQNSIHGALLSIQKLLETLSPHLTDEKMQISVTSDVLSVMPLTSDENECLVTRAAAIDIYRFVIQQKWLSANSIILSRLVNSLLKQCDYFSSADNPQFIPGQIFVERSIASFLLEIESFDSLEVSRKDVISKLLCSTSRDIRLLVLDSYQETTISQDVLERSVQLLLTEDNIPCRVSAYRLVTKYLCLSSSKSGPSFSVDRTTHFKKMFCQNYSLELLLKSLEKRILFPDVDASIPVQEDEVEHVIPLLQELLQYSDDRVSTLYY